MKTWRLIVERLYTLARRILTVPDAEGRADDDAERGRNVESM